ncbi:E3 ubiquitin-protein ligase TRIM39-like [Pleurodeles waltl]|uniref:E3 ubiquitin-protein ligase TRIM39-like n=1 Tax=Pleurodeles waltl TaxID=8319 RepID=UPI00370965C2
MAAADQSQNLEDEVTCSICLEYFENPVIIACGHNFCQFCISQCWQEVNINFACPQCRATSQERSFRPNRQLGNLVEMLKLHLPSLKSQEHVCEKHQQRLQLFCEDDQEPICVVCDRSRDHRSHTVVPVEEAAQEYKKILQSRLAGLKSCLEDVERLTTEEHRNRVALEGKFKNQTMKIAGTLEDLQRVLEQETRNILGKVEKHQMEVLEKMSLRMTVVEKQNASLKSLIGEIEGRCQQQDVQLLKDIRGLLNRADNVKVPVLEKYSPEEGQSLQSFTTHHAKLEEMIRELKEALTLGLDTAPSKTEPERGTNIGKRPELITAASAKDLLRGIDSANSPRPATSTADPHHPRASSFFATLMQIDNPFLPAPNRNAAPDPRISIRDKSGILAAISNSKSLPRADNVMKVPVLEKDPPEEGQSSQSFSTQRPKLEEKIEEFEEALTLGLDTAPSKTEPERGTDMGKQSVFVKAMSLMNLRRDVDSDNPQRPASSTPITQHPQAGSFLVTQGQIANARSSLRRVRPEQTFPSGTIAQATATSANPPPSFPWAGRE